MNIQPTLNWAIARLRKAQLEAIDKNRVLLENRGFNYDKIREMVLQSNQTAVQSEFFVMLTLNKKLRFLDMKRIAGVPVYNRPAYGVFLGSKESVKTRLQDELLETMKDTILDAISRY